MAASHVGAFCCSLCLRRYTRWRCAAALLASACDRVTRGGLALHFVGALTLDTLWTLAGVDADRREGLGGQPAHDAPPLRSHQHADLPRHAGDARNQSDAIPTGGLPLQSTVLESVLFARLSSAVRLHCGLLCGALATAALLSRHCCSPLARQRSSQAA